MQRVLLPIFLVLVIGCAGHDTNDYIGNAFLGVPYISDPLGEGIAPDNDPIIRFDAFDCTTFVETSLAGGDAQKLNKIRYRDGIPNFINRNHFIETDWLENNSDIVENVSHKFGKTQVRHVIIDKKNWFKTVHNIDTDFAKTATNLEYIPLKNAIDINPPRPVIVLFIINNPKIAAKIGTDLAVRHMGFLLPGGVLRHASRKQKRVVDVNFDKYVQGLLENKNNLGIMLLDIKK